MVFLFVTPRPAFWSETLNHVRERRPCRVEVVATGEQARATLASGSVVSIGIDPELPDESPYDLCGWVRARFRDVPITIMDDIGLDTSAHELNEDGTLWTVSDALRARMTDLSVLEVTPESIPMMSDASLAGLLGVGVAELEREKAEILRKTGFASMAELTHHVRNLPRDPSHPRPGRARPPRRLTGREPSEILAVSARPERWRDDLLAIGRAACKRVVCVPDVSLAKHALGAFEHFGVIIDPELPGTSGYDFAGFVRAHFRDLPIRILGDADVSLEAVRLGAGWTVHESLRAKMTDPSVLVVTPTSIPMLSVEDEAKVMGWTVEEVERHHRKILRESGFATAAEYLHYRRNPPIDEPS